VHALCARDWQDRARPLLRCGADGRPDPGCDRGGPTGREHAARALAHPLTAGLKDKFNIGDTIGGVFVTQVDERSEAAGRGVKRGDVIMQTNQDVVKTPDDLSRSIESARDSGKKSILLLLRHIDGKLQFVSLPLG